MAFLRADQSRAKNCCQIGWIGCRILQVARETILRFQFLAYFCNTLSNQVDMKNIVNCLKDFMLYFTTLETYRDQNLSKYRFTLLMTLSLDDPVGKEAES